MKNILFSIFILIGITIFPTLSSGIYYEWTNIFPNIIWTEGNIIAEMYTAWLNGSNGNWANIYFDDFTSTDIIDSISVVCIPFRASYPQWAFYYDDTFLSPPKISLLHSGSSIYMDIKAFWTVNTDSVLLATFKTWSTSNLDNHPNENAFCATFTYSVKRSWFFGLWRYLYWVWTYHYYWTWMTYNELDYHTWYSELWYRYADNTSPVSPLYLNASRRYYFSSIIPNTVENNLKRVNYMETFLTSLNSSWTNLLLTLPDYYNSLTSTWNSENYVDNSWSWTLWISWPNFSSCSTFEIWCYISKTFSWILWDYMPDFSFSTNFNSCSTWSTSSWWTISEKLWRLIHIVNPIPPEEWTLICWLFWSWILDYSQASQSWNIFSIYAHGQVPAVLEGDGIVAYGQNILDIVMIIGVFILIFRPKKHD